MTELSFYSAIIDTHATMELLTYGFTVDAIEIGIILHGKLQLPWLTTPTLLLDSEWLLFDLLTGLLHLTGHVPLNLTVKGLKLFLQLFQLICFLPDLVGNTFQLGKLVGI